MSASVAVLLDHGADINVEAKNGMTALPYAVVKGHEALADLLRKRGAVPDKLTLITNSQPASSTDLEAEHEEDRAAIRALEQKVARRKME
jgi:ankyrin repeat protein